MATEAGDCGPRHRPTAGGGPRSSKGDSDTIPITIRRFRHEILFQMALLCGCLQRMLPTVIMVISPETRLDQAGHRAHCDDVDCNHDHDTDD